MTDIPTNRSLKVASIPSASSDVWGQILQQLEANDFDQEDIFAVHLALEEAFVNAVKHGNKMDTAKMVTVDYSVDTNKVDISVTDEGPGFDPQGVPDPRCGENIYKTSGRGLLLIRSYMDLAEYNQRGNSLHMVKYRKDCR